MQRVGIRGLKTHLSHHLKRVRSGAQLLVTDRGRSIATISPVEAAADVRWAHALVAAGQARWSGKPAGYRRAYDSVHLASFLEIARRAGVAASRFSSLDDRLNRAARAAALRVARTR